MSLLFDPLAIWKLNKMPFACFSNTFFVYTLVHNSLLYSFDSGFKSGFLLNIIILLFLLHPAYFFAHHISGFCPNIKSLISLYLPDLEIKISVPTSHSYGSFFFAFCAFMLVTSCMSSPDLQQHTATPVPDFFPAQGEEQCAVSITCNISH